MSCTKLEEIRCPCGEVFEAELYNSINAVEDPDLRESLLCGEINVVCCPVCNQIFYAEHFVLYHDPSSELIAFVYPTAFSTDEKFWKERMDQDFKKALDAMPDSTKLTYRPMILFGLDRLVDILKEEDEINDEISILEYSAQELGIELIRLKPSTARELKLPRVMPCTNIDNQREGIIDGIKKILDHNQHLQWYAKLLKLIEHHKDWYIIAKPPAKKPPVKKTKSK